MSNDADEEVYEGEGDEPSAAREASDGNPRAIADADQAGQLVICRETKTPRALRTPEPPTDAASMLHDMTPVPFRDETGAHSAGQVEQEVRRTTSCSKQDIGYSAEVLGRGHDHMYCG